MQRFQRPQPVMLRAELRHCEWDEQARYGWNPENVVEEMPVYYYDRDLDHISDPEWQQKMREAYCPARYIADCIAMTRNIAATWNIVSVTLDGIDVTEAVNSQWLKYYVSRRLEFA